LISNGHKHHLLGRMRALKRTITPFYIIRFKVIIAAPQECFMATLMTVCASLN